MKKVTKKAFGILALVVLSVPAQAGWLSNLGQRIVNGAANTVQTNISGKVNKAVNDVMDGKAVPKKGTTGKYKESIKSENVEANNNYMNQIVETDNNTAGDLNKVSSTNQRGKTIPYNNRFEQIDLGITKFVGELIYHKPISIGEYGVKFEEFLAPGKYRIIATGRSYKDEVNILSMNETGGPYFGYGIVIIKIYNHPGERLVAGEKGLDYEVEVLKGQQGHLKMGMLNMSKNGAADFFIYKIPDTAK